MACILKIPSKKQKGIVTFTSQELLRFINKDKSIQEQISKIKDRWVVGIHHNWHNFKFRHNPLFDFDMAGDTDLIEVNNRSFLHIPIECTHFSPEFFHFSQNDKMWDILYVGRAINFKKIPEFLNIIRKLYDNGKMYRVLFISPISKDCRKNPDLHGNFCKIQDMYLKMFNAKERKLFNLITIDYDYPFPFDIETLSHFYKSSRIFVFTSDDERRPRTVSYAMASGMPTVLMESVASLLPKSKQQKPLVYLANSFEEYPTLIEEAISYATTDEYSKESMIDGINEFDTTYNLNRLNDIFLKEFDIDLFEEDNKYNALYELDIRLARHYGFGENSNSIGWSLQSFLNYLKNRNFEDMQDDLTHDDLERYISDFSQYGKKELESLDKTTFKEKVKKFIFPYYSKSSFLKNLYQKYINKI